MASRKEIYEKLEAIEGGEAIRDSLKELFQADDTKLQESVDALKVAKGEATTLGDSLNELKQASENSVPKTEMEKAMSEMQKTLKEITDERDAANEIAKQAEVDKRNGEISSHFSKAVIDAFGAKNTEMAVGFGMSKGVIKYTEDNQMAYGDKVGDEAIEAFKADNSHLIQNRGTATTGGNTDSTTTGFVDELREQMLRD